MIWFQFRQKCTNKLFFINKLLLASMLLTYGCRLQWKWHTVDPSTPEECPDFCPLHTWSWSLSLPGCPPGPCNGPTRGPTRTYRRVTSPAGSHSEHHTGSSHTHRTLSKDPKVPHNKSVEVVCPKDFNCSHWHTCIHIATCLSIVNKDNNSSMTGTVSPSWCIKLTKFLKIWTLKSYQQTYS